jgi:hypothetical protein
MDRATLLDNLAIALRRVAEGELHIAQQHESIVALERLGLDRSVAKAALLQIEKLQGMLVAERNRLQRELAEKHPHGPTHLSSYNLVPRPRHDDATWCLGWNLAWS